MEPQRRQNEPPKYRQILIVDHDDGTRQLLVAAVSKQGCRAEIAGNGYEALRKIRLSSPDLVVLDMMLPDAGGYEVLRNLQEAGKPGVPIISLIDADFDVSISDILRREPNVVECLRKPVQDNVLADVLRRVLDTREPS